ncbi:MAG TPA: methyltransferase domain-containing protein [Ktedonobacterales bacterium]|nr:methyltransferase domain-containing protein [Ktedonobacterales bacterium]
MSAPIESNSPTPDELRQALVEKLRRDGVLRDDAVERAMCTVPRHLFLPDAPLEAAYSDNAILTHEEDGVPISSASQPAIVAIMLQQLAVEPGMRVLEIGAGTGYNAALLAELAGPTGHVTTVDIGEEIAAEARAHLDAARYGRVRVIAADGAAGWPEDAPYDRIELTVGATDVTPAWYEQLAEGGLLALPLWLGMSDASVAFRKHGGALHSESLAPCGFMRLRGAEKSAMQWISLGNGLSLGSDDAERLAGPIRALLAAHPRRKLHFMTDPSLVPWLGLRGLRLVVLGPDAHRRSFVRPRIRYGVYAEGADGPSLSIFAARLPMLVSFGGREAERQIVAAAEQWQATRRIPLEQWRITAWPHGTDRGTGIEPPPLQPGTYRQVRRHFTYDITCDVAAEG